MVGLTKIVLYKSFGISRLPFEQLKEALLEAEVILNNHPLGYLRDDIQHPALTPNMLIHDTNISRPDEIADDEPDFNSPTQPRILENLNRCKNALWKRWSEEYLQSLSDRHKCFNGIEPVLKVGDIVRIKGDKKNRGEWEIGIITRLIKTKDWLLPKSK